jgi:F0F1-type ATP synthase assembly protein I
MPKKKKNPEKLSDKEVVREIKKLEEIEYGIKELMTGIFIGLIIGFFLALFLMR